MFATTDTDYVKITDSDPAKLDEKCIDWLTNEIEKFDNVKDQFFSADFSSIYYDSTRQTDVASNETIIKLMKFHNYDYEQAKITLEHKIALNKYKDNFKVDYTSSLEKNAGKEAIFAETNKINELNNKFKIFKENQNIKTLITDVQNIKKEELKLEKLVANYDDVSECLLKERYKLLTFQLQGYNHSGSYQETTDGLKQMEEKLEELKNNNENFKLQSFKDLVRDYAHAWGLGNYDEKDAQREFNDYKTAFNSINYLIYYKKLQNEYKYIEDELNKFIVVQDDNNRKKTHQKFKNEYDRVTTELNELKNDPNIIDLLNKYNSNLLVRKISIEQLFKDEDRSKNINHKKANVHNFLLVEEYKKKFNKEEEKTNTINDENGKTIEAANKNSKW